MQTINLASGYVLLDIKLTYRNLEEVCRLVTIGSTIACNKIPQAFFSELLSFRADWADRAIYLPVIAMFPSGPHPPHYREQFQLRRTP